LPLFFLFFPCLLSDFTPANNALSVALSSGRDLKAALGKQLSYSEKL